PLAARSVSSPTPCGVRRSRRRTTVPQTRRTPPPLRETRRPLPRVARVTDPGSVMPARELESGRRDILHRLNNQLGIVLGHAELLESKATDASDPSRAARIAASTLEAISAARALRQQSTIRLPELFGSSQ